MINIGSTNDVKKIIQEWRGRLQRQEGEKRKWKLYMSNCRCTNIFPCYWVYIQKSTLDLKHHSPRSERMLVREKGALAYALYYSTLPSNSVDIDGKLTVICTTIK